MIGGVSASSNSSNTTGDQINFLVIGTDRTTSQMVKVMHNISADYPHIKFKARSVSQAGNNLTEIPELIDWADIIYLDNIEGGPVSDRILELHAEGRMNNKTVVVMGMPTWYVPLIRITNIGGTRFVSQSEEPLTDVQMQLMYQQLRGYTANSSLIDEVKLQYPAAANYIEAYRYLSRDLLMYFLALRYPDGGFTYRPPVSTKPYVIYRNGTEYQNFASYSSYVKPGRPTVGIIAYRHVTLGRGDSNILDALVTELESRGINTIPVVAEGNPANGLNVIRAINEYFIDRTANTSRVDAIINLAWLIGGSMGQANGTSFLSSFGVPVFSPLQVWSSGYLTTDYWQISQQGLDYSFGSEMAIEETQGHIEQILIATMKTSVDPVTGLEMVVADVIPERLIRICERISNWLKLRYMNNTEKIVALVYYNYPPGRENLAGGNSLNGPESILSILRLLKENGYTLEVPANVDELIATMLGRGRNLELAGELENASAGMVLWDVSEFMEWFMELPDITRKEMEEGPLGYIEVLASRIYTIPLSKRTIELNKLITHTLTEWKKGIESAIREMGNYLNLTQRERALELLERAYSALQGIVNCEDRWAEFRRAKSEFLEMKIPGLCGWGKPPGDLMVIERGGKKYFVLPIISFGKVYIGPQPMRGYEDASMLYHSQVIPPTYQYLAFYAYLQTRINASAIIHLGQHGTYEWLPRKDIALSGSDYPDICIGNVPAIYIYNMDGVGEAIHAKRRGLSVVIGHLTQPFTGYTLTEEMSQLKNLIGQYMLTSNEGRPAVFTEIRRIAENLNLLSLIDEENMDESADALDEYLKGLENTVTPLGLHSFGVDWTTERVMALATTILTRNRVIPVNGTVYLTPKEALSGLPGSLDSIILQIIAGTSLQEIIASLQVATGRNLTSTELKALNLTETYVRNIIISPMMERKSLLDALNGRYIAAATGDDPVRNPASLPTGRNLYGLDQQKIPYNTAWIRGRALAEDALRSFNTTPEQLGVILWATETQRDQGATVSFIMRLLGVEPVYGGTGGSNVIGVRATPLSQLNRPRVDVVVTITGVFRETFPQVAVLLDRGFRVALAASYNTIVQSLNSESPSMRSKIINALDSAVKTIKEAGLFTPGNDSLEMNSIARHWLSDVRYLLGMGINETEAGKAAIQRVFGPPGGEWGSKTVREGVHMTDTWDDRGELARGYISDMGFAYAEDSWESVGTAIFTRRLSAVTAAYHSRSTNVHGILDLDHNFEFLGGMRLAVEYLSGSVPGMFILNQRDPASSTVETASQFIMRDLHTKFFNREWIEAMMKEGYAGARSISSDFFSNMWGWQVVAPEVINDRMWNDALDIYLKDRYRIGVSRWLSEGSNAYSMIALSETFLKAAYRGFWSASEGDIRFVANTWARLVKANGVTGGHIDINMVTWTLQYVDPDLMEAVKNRLYAATKSSAFAPSSDGSTPDVPSTPGNSGDATSGSGTSGSSAGRARSTSANGGARDSVSAESESSEVGEAKGPSNAKAYEVKKHQSISEEKSEIPVYAVVGVISLLCLIGLGYYLGPRGT
ncbi:cobaltochelatase subunit CobN [Methanothermobacter sp.]|uniref:cobaltochelatase subunit CobN n=1 Tax=Methanothermobacter sp. TaxID=1884223 RepID=UPI002633EA50|nr:cobaltochelatase subunit CobN [Methanothermobacter sp.]MDI9614329.1 cobaltochelatase subunit CobN [Methanothermobacter sp.]